MDLMSDDAIGAFGLLVAEAAERLVDSHDESFDKRAAMLTVESPVFSRDDGRMQFAFKVKGNRQQAVAASIEVAPESGTEDQDEDFDFSPLSVSLAAIPACSCEQFKSGQRCPHTLAISWWLQEQLGRRSITDIFEFFGELEVDSVAAGRELVDELLELAEDSREATDADEETCLQWRVGLSNSRYYCPISITAYEQRPRKNGKGWTKGKEVRSYDLLRRDFSKKPVDGRIALVSNPSYSFEGDHFGEFQALQMLATPMSLGTMAMRRRWRSTPASWCLPSILWKLRRIREIMRTPTSCREQHSFAPDSKSTVSKLTLTNAILCWGMQALLNRSLSWLTRSTTGWSFVPCVIRERLG